MEAFSDTVFPVKQGIGGTTRVSGIFLPRSRGSQSIRIKSPSQKVAVARRRLARVIEPRRLAS